MPRNEEKKAFMGIGRLCVVLVIALLLAWFLLPVFRGIVNIGNAAGILLCSFALWLAGYPGAAGCLSSLWGQDVYKRQGNDRRAGGSRDGSVFHNPHHPKGGAGSAAF